jgi:hypothetical protein
MIETASLNSYVFGWLARRLSVRLAGILAVDRGRPGSLDDA